MIKVLIAEDEAIERKALKYLFFRYFPEKIAIVAVVDNGHDAVNSAVDKKPDLIMMDIKMPVMDGLQASEVIRQQLPDVEIIILTAHSEFEYARQAVQFRAFDYLLKPCSTEKFCNAINKAIAKIESRKTNNERQYYFRKRMKEWYPYIEREIIMEMIYGKELSKEEFEEYKKILNISGKQYLAVIISTDQDRYFNKKIMAECRKCFQREIAEVLGFIGLKDLIFLLFGNRLLQMKKEGYLKSLLREIIKLLKECYGIKACAAMGDVFHEGTRLFKSYNKARIALESNEGLIGYYQNQDIRSDRPVFPYKKESAICEKIVNEDLKGASIILKDILIQMVNQEKAMPDIIIQYLKELIIYINRYIVNYFGNHFELPFDYRNIEEKLSKLKNLQELESYMQYLIARMIETIANYKLDTNVQIIEDVKRYLEENFKNEVSLNDVAEQFSFSQYYLSRLFKKIEGINYRDYLIKLRMEKAKELLKEGKSIKDVTYLVGYSDPNYFSRAFKKYSGVSPSSYNN